MDVAKHYLSVDTLMMFKWWMIVSDERMPYGLYDNGRAGFFLCDLTQSTFILTIYRPVGLEHPRKRKKKKKENFEKTLI